MNTCRGANDFKWMDVIFHVEKNIDLYEGTCIPFRIKMEALKKRRYFSVFNLSYSVSGLTVINYTLTVIIRKLIGENEHNNRNQ